MLTRRSFFRGLLAGAMLGVARVLPMPETARVQRITALFCERMQEEIARVLFYGDPPKPEQFVGLTPRYSDSMPPSRPGNWNGINDGD